ncbi:hypothetical protein [Medusavirus stheno T3]|uniref:Uncharacterized protein n=1 Tax=Medusavirus stheno T3 TaxID=3069717 RepID=A0A7S7YFM5_9VIRU|nr:hypothetical protein QKU73_gp064 [Acanthamoeba castellanii medusavirus]QPB44245.1 hypothetical protein [Medusavirus stheno T3]
MGDASDYEKTAVRNIIAMWTIASDKQHTFENVSGAYIDAAVDLPEGCSTVILWHCHDVVLNMRHIRPTAVKLLNCSNVQVFMRRGCISTIDISRSHNVVLDVMPHEDAGWNLDVAFSSNVHFYCYGSPVLISCTASMNLSFARERSAKYPAITYYDRMFDDMPLRMQVPSLKQVIEAARADRQRALMQSVLLELLERQQ